MTTRYTGGNSFEVLGENIVEIKRDVKELVLRLGAHIESPGHPIMQADIDQLKQDVETLKTRPLKSWQLVTGLIGLGISLLFVVLSCSGFLLSLLTFFRLHP